MFNHTVSNALRGLLTVLWVIHTVPAGLKEMGFARCDKQFEDQQLRICFTFLPLD